MLKSKKITNDDDLYAYGAGQDHYQGGEPAGFKRGAAGLYGQLISGLLLSAQAPPHSVP